MVLIVIDDCCPPGCVEPAVVDVQGEEGEGHQVSAGDSSDWCSSQEQERQEWLQGGESLTCCPLEAGWGEG